jgi:hypothetical protein
MIIFDILIDVVGYTVARLVLPLFSFGRIYVEPLNAPLRKFSALGYRHDESGRIEIDSTVAGWIGFVVCLIAFFAFGLLIRAAV